MNTAAEKLTGLTIEGGWKVVELITKDPRQTGGYFSVPYRVESKDGETAFLKALDFQKFITPTTPDVAAVVANLTNAYVYERDILRRCREDNLNRIIRTISDGQLDIEGNVVPYIIFEMADSDVRKQANKFSRFDTAWALRTMHHVAIGISQLHSRGIAHQDLKPSNVLVVNGIERKLGDLGRSATANCTLPHINSCIAGDTGYAPPEGLYGFTHPDWRERRYGCDCYQMGNLMTFMFTGLTAIAILLASLDEEHRPHLWGGTYEEVLPFLNNAFVNSVDYIVKYVDEEEIEQDVRSIIRQLCHPDINQRGDPVKRGMGANPFSMERYISRFDYLAKIVERGIIRTI